MALRVAEIDHLIGDAHPVGRQREAEVFPVLSLDGPRVAHDLLHDVEIQERFAAEKVDFQIMPGAGIFDQEIDRALPDFRAHQRARPMETPLAGEAIGAGQVATVGNVETKRFDLRMTVFQHPRARTEDILAEKLAGFLQGQDVLIGLRDIRFRHRRAVDQAAPVFFHHGGHDLVAALLTKKTDDVVSNIIHQMYRTAINVDYDIVTIAFILMNHQFFFSHSWFATPQEVLQADWQLVWHSPQPPSFRLSFRSRVSIVLILFMYLTFLD